MHHDVLERAISEAHGEVDLQYVGRVFKHKHSGNNPDKGPLESDAL
jgi:hypothetical protein